MSDAIPSPSEVDADAASAATFQRWWAFAESFARPHPPVDAEMKAPDGAGLQCHGFSYPIFTAAQHYIGYPTATWVEFLTEKPVIFRNLAFHFFWKRLNGPYMLPGVAISAVDWAFTDPEEAIAEIQRQLKISGEAFYNTVDPLTQEHIQHLDISAIHSIWQWRVALYDSLNYRGRWPAQYRRALECRDLALRIGASPPGDF